MHCKHILVAFSSTSEFSPLIIPIKIKDTAKITTEYLMIFSVFLIILYEHLRIYFTESTAFLSNSR